MHRGLKYASTILRNRRTDALQRCSPLTTLPAQSQPNSHEFKFHVGSKYEGFLCTEVEPIHEFNMVAYIFKHIKLGSPYLHLDRNDSNNVFSINFRTTPYDSTGLPHILEHNVLCGSERFPVRDPFFKMLNRSMSTFMNAMTGPDYTMYPFSSMNETDYRNLQKIYLDAVFKPNLEYLDFLQEGWRLENKNLTEKDSEYVIKGVVYNEMKGAFSETSNLFSSKFLNEILPDNTYQHCSGGEPLVIPDLTHKALVDFHRKYYHPSNARFYSYGNFSLLPTLKYVNEEYLNKYDPIDPTYSKVPTQTRWKQPRSQNIHGRFDEMGAPMEKQNQIAVGYLISDVANVEETMLLHVLTELLYRGPNSRFYKNLIEPNFSGGYHSVTGLETTIRDTMFVIGLQDVDRNDFAKIEKILHQTIDEVVAEGFDAEHVNSVINNFELSLKHQSARFGLSLLFNLTAALNHDADIVQSLHFDETLKKIRTKINGDPQYLQTKVKEYFQENAHKLTLTMTPDVEFEKKFTDKEQLLIQQKVNELSIEAKEQLFGDCQRLADAQKKQENLDILPCLKLSDVVDPPLPFHVEFAKIGGIDTQIVATNTNNVTYVRGLYNAIGIEPEHRPILPLLACIIDQMGTTTYDYRTFDKYVHSITSGINFSVHAAECMDNVLAYNVGLSFRSYCLEQNIPKMFEIINDLLTKFNFSDVQRFEMLLGNYVSDLTVGIANSGHLYAMKEASGLVTQSANLSAKLYGIEHISYIKNLMQNRKPNEILQLLGSTAEQLFRKANLKCALNTSEKILEPCMEEYGKFISNTVNAEQIPVPPTISSGLLPSSNVHNVMSIPVNFTAKSIFTVPYLHDDSVPLQVLGKILSAKYLLKVVREQNGAYGAGAKLSKDGLFSFFSYRDPNTCKTFDIFDQSAQWIHENFKTIDDQTLFEAKLGVLQSLDAPVEPGSKGQDVFKFGLTQEMANKVRLNVLKVSHDDLMRVTQLYLNKSDVPTGRYVLGPKNDDLKAAGFVINQRDQD